MKTLFFQAQSGGLPSVLHLPHDNVFAERPFGYLPDEFDILANGKVIAEIRYHEARGQIECNIVYEDSPIGAPLTNGWTYISRDAHFSAWKHASGAVFILFLSGVTHYG